MRLIALLASISFILSCQNQPATQEAEAGKVKIDTAAAIPVANDIIPAKKIDTVPYNIQIDTVIHFAIAEDSNSVTTKGSINKNGDPVVCYFSVKKKGKLKATITPVENQLNVRFSQIVMPDMNSDGPFGRQLQYDLRQTGSYKLIIAPNTMAEGKRSGDFTVKMEIR